MRNLFTALLLICSVGLFAQNKETRDVGNFDEVMMSVDGTVYIKMGDKNEVILEGSSSDLEKIETNVRGGRLKIGTEGNGRWWKSWRDSPKIDVYITVKEINGLYVSSSGDIVSQGTLKSDDFETSVSGSGGIEVEVDARNVSSKISGSGSIELSGGASDARLSISGSGKYYAEDLRVDDYTISISGSGRATVNLEGELDVRISGSGNVYYKGNPSGVNSSTSGSGKVRRMR